MKKQIMACVLAVGCVTSVCLAESEGGRDHGRPQTLGGKASPEWKKNVEASVNDPTKIAAIMKALPESQRAAFAKEVMAQLEAKQAKMPNQKEFRKQYAAVAAALVAAANGAKEAVMQVVVASVVQVAAPDTGSWTKEDVKELKALVKEVVSALPEADRSVFVATTKTEVKQEAMSEKMQEIVQKQLDKVEEKVIDGYQGQS